MEGRGEGVGQGKKAKRKKRVEEFVKAGGTFTIPGAAVREHHGVEVPAELKARVAEAEVAVPESELEADVTDVTDEAGEEKGGGGRAVITGDERAEVLRFLYGQLAATDEDLAKWDEARGLAPCVARACGLRSNRAENLPLLQALVPRFSVGACVAAGVWERHAGAEDGQLAHDAAERWAKRFPPGRVPEAVEGCVPSRFFFGFGQIAQVRLQHAAGTPGRAGQVDSLKRDLGRRHAACGPLNFWEHDNKLVVSGFNGQPIIPYFDWLPAEDLAAGAAGGLDLGCITEGELKAIAWWSATAEGVRQMAAPRAEQLIALRTHKKWAKDARAHCFTTRPAGGSIRFAGRTWRPGVAALPGITYGRKQGGTWVVRHELDEWLRLNGMTGALVVFDNEEKGDPALPGYKDEVDKRFDSVLWGLALARDLGRERHAWFAMLPEELRDAQGKVDWDGAIVKLRGERCEVRSGEKAADGGPRTPRAPARTKDEGVPPMPPPVLDLGDEENPFHRDES